MENIMYLSTKSSIFLNHIKKYLLKQKINLEKILRWRKGNIQMLKDEISPIGLKDKNPQIQEAGQILSRIYLYLNNTTKLQNSKEGFKSFKKNKQDYLQRHKIN
jgi:hypothetical protein